MSSEERGRERAQEREIEKLLAEQNRTEDIRTQIKKLS
jgi:hypothetical protein